MAVSLKDVQAMADTLGAADQIRLLQHLFPRLAQAALIGAADPVDSEKSNAEAPRYREVVPLRLEGIPASDLLIEDRG